LAALPAAVSPPVPVTPGTATARAEVIERDKRLVLLVFCLECLQCFVSGDQFKSGLPERPDNGAQSLADNLKVVHEKFGGGGHVWAFPARPKRAAAFLAWLGGSLPAAVQLGA